MGIWKSVPTDHTYHRCTFDIFSPNIIATIIHHWSKNEHDLYIPFVLKQEIEKYVPSQRLLRLNEMEMLRLGYKQDQIRDITNKSYLFKTMVVSIYNDLYHQIKRNYIYDLSLEEIHFNDYQRRIRPSHDVEYMINHSSFSSKRSQKQMKIALRLVHGFAEHEMAHYIETCLNVFVLNRYSEDSFFHIKNTIDRFKVWETLHQQFIYYSNSRTITILCEPKPQSEVQMDKQSHFEEPFIKLYCREHDIFYAGFIDFSDPTAIRNMIELYVFEYVKRITKECTGCGQIFVK
eukprot:222241_1